MTVAIAAYGRYQGLVKRLARPLFRWLWPVDVSGKENVPGSGPAVLCPNHLAAIDSLIVPSVLDRVVRFVGKVEFLDWRTKWILPALGMIPIDRRGGRRSKSALRAAKRVLDAGELFVIYPEGTRSRTGKLYRGHTGAARLAISSGAPIVPIGLIGTDEVQPIGAVLPRPFRKTEMRIGEPIEVEPYRARRQDHAVYRELIDEVMAQIQRLTGQEYVPHYAGKESEAEPTAEPMTQPMRGA